MKLLALTEAGVEWEGEATVLSEEEEGAEKPRGRMNWLRAVGTNALLVTRENADIADHNTNEN
jgi:hypothetical protein